MTLGRLVIKDLFRNPLRLALTVLAAGVGVLAFVFLQTVVELFYAGIALSQPDRLIVRSRVSITQLLPLAYERRIATVPGVGEITYAGFFGGRLSEEREGFFANFYVEKSTYLRVFDEYVVSPQELAAWKADPCGAIAGEALAQQYGWKVGERITLKGAIYPGDYDLTLRGIYRGRRPQVDTTTLAFGYRCFNERQPSDRKDFVGFFAIRIDDPSRSGAVARQVDALFENSPYPTLTESERAFQLSFVAQSSAILTAVRVVSYAVLLILLLVVGNTLAMNVREKTMDLATLRAIGFTRRQIAWMVIAESVAIGAASAGFGVALAPPVVRGFTRAVAASFGPVQEIVVSPGVLLLAAAAALGAALIAGLLPALKAATLEIAEGLRRTA